MSAESSLIPESTLAHDIRPEKPLNAEEATITVLDFLGRLGKSVVTPKNATLNGDIFVVEVDLKKATAIVRVNSTTREITEYSITPQVEETKPLPVPSRKSLIMMLGLIAAICLFMVLRFQNISTGNILGLIDGSSDLLIIGGIGIVPIIILLIWWRRRS